VRCGVGERAGGTRPAPGRSLTVRHLRHPVGAVVDGRLRVVDHLPMGPHPLADLAAVRLVHLAEDRLQVGGETGLDLLQKVKQLLIHVRLAATGSLTDLIDRNDPAVLRGHRNLQLLRYPAGGTFPPTRDTVHPAPNPYHRPFGPF